MLPTPDYTRTVIMSLALQAHQILPFLEARKDNRVENNKENKVLFSTAFKLTLSMVVILPVYLLYKGLGCYPNDV